MLMDILKENIILVIIAAVVILICIAAIIILHLRKNQKREQIVKDINAYLDKITDDDLEEYANSLLSEEEKKEFEDIINSGIQNTLSDFAKSGLDSLCNINSQMSDIFDMQESSGITDGSDEKDDAQLSGDAAELIDSGEVVNAENKADAQDNGGATKNKATPKTADDKTTSKPTPSGAAAKKKGATVKKTAEPKDKSD